MMGTVRLALLLAMTVLLVHVHKGESLKCWSCDSTELRGCSDPFLGSADVKEDRFLIKDSVSKVWKSYIQILPNGTMGPIYTDGTPISDGFVFVCLKITGKLLGDKFVFRNCALGLPNITEGSCVSSVLGSRLHERFGGTLETCETCAGDLCNGATRIGRTAVLMSTLMQILLLKK